MKQRFAEREARRQQEGAQDRETGEMGVFALVNQQLGDNSEAAKIQRRSQETSLNAMSQQSNGRFSKPQQVQAPQDRKSLMASRVRGSPPCCHSTLRIGAYLFRESSYSLSALLIDTVLLS